MNGRTSSAGFLDYVSGWFVKAADWISSIPSRAAFVSTNSICQGQSVPILWPILFDASCVIAFAHTSFKWSNLASNKAGVTVAIIGIARDFTGPRRIYEDDPAGRVQQREGASISPYLTFGPPLIVEKRPVPADGLAIMEFGNKPSDGGNLILSRQELESLPITADQRLRLTRRIIGAEDFIHGRERYCLWIEDKYLQEAQRIPAIADRIERVRQTRLASPDKGAHVLARRAHQLKLMAIGKRLSIVAPRVTSESRPYLPVGLVDDRTSMNDQTFALYDAQLWNLALIASRLHLVWIATVCGKLETRYRYSNTLGWNTFPVRRLTAQDKADLTRTAENILLARESHFPATIADLYDPGAMPDDLRRAHDENDEVLERIYIGRRFRNDTERLEKLFDLYSKMTADAPKAKKGKHAA